MNEKTHTYVLAKKDTSNRIRNTRQYVSAVLKSNFGKAQVKKQSAFALAFEKALSE